MHLALGGCLGVPPVRFGLTADTGGHIAYVMEAACAQSALARQVSVVTRRIVDARLGAEFARPCERVNARLTIDRVAGGNAAYLEKEALAAELADFTAAFCRHLDGLAVLPDVIHAHFADAAAVALAARARFAIPVVYTPHALGIDKGRAAGDAALDARIAAERCAISAADAIIVSTRDERDRQLAAYGVGLGDRVACLAPGIPRRAAVDGDATAIDGWFDAPDKPIVLAIARPVHKKNLGGLVRAYAGAPALMAAANLVILAGQHDGVMSDEGRAVLAELRQAPLRGRLALPSRHDAADVSALYRRAARGGVFVNPALHEPFGLTLIEAAAAGVPVVATRHGGPADILAATGHGLLVDPREPAAIAAACLRIVSDPALHGRLSRAGLANAHRFSWQRYAAASTAIYARHARMVAVA